LGANRDIIILEQRGNLYARPSLLCESSVWWLEAEGDTACLDTLQGQGIDLTHYTTQQIVADIEALRQALGIEAWNLYGVSYSTRLMLLTMRQYPQSVRSVILDSVSPPNDTPYAHDPEHVARALSRLFEDCAADPACAAAYPDLESRFYRLFSRLNVEPASFRITHDDTGNRLDDPFTQEVSGYDLLEWMVTDAFYGPAYGSGKTPLLPLLIDRVEAGNTRLLYPWLISHLSDVFSSSSEVALGLHFAVNCQNDFPRVTPDDILATTEDYPELEGYVRHAREMEICELWDLPAAPLDGEPVQSDTPTLVLAGGYDPITPPAWGKATVETLGTSYYYEFPAAGHSVASQSDCALQIQAAFLANPGAAPGASCLADEPRPEFVLADDVLIAPRFHTSVYDMDLGTPRGKPWVEGAVLGGMVLFLVEIGFLAVSGIVWLVQRRKRGTSADLIAKFAHPIAGLTALLGTSILPLMSDINKHIPPGLTYFGLPAPYTPARLLGIIAPTFAVLSGVLTVLTTLTWVRRTWSLPKRLLFTLVTLAAMVFIPLLIRWGLITLLL
jgi:pimeloyl-ACP methyl ester carboxylesterase